MLRAATLAALLLVSGCGANHNAIYRTFSSEVEVGEDGDTVDPNLAGFIIDAKQRAMLAKYDRNTNSYIYCVEPSPDAFSVLSSSFAASGQLSKNAADASAAAQLATAMNETGSTIARTQTIQILREAMYRTCERFANGDMGDEEMAIQAIRDQRMIVSVLAIEQLTGSITPPTVAISATAEADTGKTALEIQENLEKARAKLETKRKAVPVAEAVHKPFADKVQKTGEKVETAKSNRKLAEDELKAAKKTQSDVEKEPTKSAQANLTTKQAEEIAAKKEEVKAKVEAADTETALAKAKADLKLQTDMVASFEERLAAAMAVSASGDVMIKFGNCDSCKPTPVSPQSAQTIAAAVVEIVDKTFKLDEVELKCLKLVDRLSRQGQTAQLIAGSSQERAVNQYAEFCFAYLGNRTATETQERLDKIEAFGDISVLNPKPKPKSN